MPDGEDRRQYAPGVRIGDAVPTGACACGCGQRTNIAKQTIRRLGYMKGEPFRFVWGHNGGKLKHGFTKLGQPWPSPYAAWSSMQQRCTNPARRDYPDYGGRGIRVCELWRDFRNFLADVGPRPSPQHSLDRIDNDGNYEPGNVRWATAKEQRANRRAMRSTLTAEQRSMIGRKGGRARVAKMTAAERSEQMRQAWMTRRAAHTKKREAE